MLQAIMHRTAQRKRGQVCTTIPFGHPPCSFSTTYNGPSLKNHHLPGRIAEDGLSFWIPLALFAHYLGPLGTLQGQVWRGNFFKCAEENSHPHWASWLPVDEFNFHRPNCFGSLRLA